MRARPRVYVSGRARLLPDRGAREPARGCNGGRGYKSRKEREVFRKERRVANKRKISGLKISRVGGTVVGI